MKDWSAEAKAMRRLLLKVTYYMLHDRLEKAKPVAASKIKLTDAEHVINMDFPLENGKGDRMQVVTAMVRLKLRRRTRARIYGVRATMPPGIGGREAQLSIVLALMTMDEQFMQDIQAGLEKVPAETSLLDSIVCDFIYHIGPVEPSVGGEQIG